MLSYAEYTPTGLHQILCDWESDPKTENRIKLITKPGTVELGATIECRSKSTLLVGTEKALSSGHVINKSAMMI